MVKAKIHPTAIVHKGAKLADGVEVGPYAIIEDNVSIGRDTNIGPRCFVGAFTTIGSANRIFTGAIVGSISQDLKFKGERSFLKIGNGNMIREYATLNRSSASGGETVVGDDNFFMAYSHVAHDCVVGSRVILANCGTLAGHVTVEDGVIIGGLGGAHQFVKIGALSIIGGLSKATQDIPPYSIADGSPARVKGINSIGLKRAGFKTKDIRELKKANKLLFFSGLSTSHAIREIKKTVSPSKEIDHLIKFTENSQRGLPR